MITLREVLQLVDDAPKQQKTPSDVILEVIENPEFGRYARSLCIKKLRYSSVEFREFVQRFVRYVKEYYEANDLASDILVYLDRPFVDTLCAYHEQVIDGLVDSKRAVVDPFTFTERKGAPPSVTAKLLSVASNSTTKSGIRLERKYPNLLRIEQDRTKSGYEPRKATLVVAYSPKVAPSAALWSLRERRFVFCGYLQSVIYSEPMPDDGFLVYVGNIVRRRGDLSGGYSGAVFEPMGTAVLPSEQTAVISKSSSVTVLTSLNYLKADMKQLVSCSHYGTLLALAYESKKNNGYIDLVLMHLDTDRHRVFERFMAVSDKFLLVATDSAHLNVQLSMDLVANVNLVQKTFFKPGARRASNSQDNDDDDEDMQIVEDDSSSSSSSSSAKEKVGQPPPAEVVEGDYRDGSEEDKSNTSADVEIYGFSADTESRKDRAVIEIQPNSKLWEGALLSNPLVGFLVVLPDGVTMTDLLQMVQTEMFKLSTESVVSAELEKRQVLVEPSIELEYNPVDVNVPSLMHLNEIAMDFSMQSNEIRDGEDIDDDDDDDDEEDMAAAGEEGENEDNTWIVDEVDEYDGLMQDLSRFSSALSINTNRYSQAQQQKGSKSRAVMREIVRETGTEAADLLRRVRDTVRQVLVDVLPAGGDAKQLPQYDVLELLVDYVRIFSLVKDATNPDKSQAVYEAVREAARQQALEPLLRDMKTIGAGKDVSELNAVLVYAQKKKSE